MDVQDVSRSPGISCFTDQCLALTGGGSIQGALWCPGWSVLGFQARSGARSTEGEVPMSLNSQGARPAVRTKMLKCEVEGSGGLDGSSLTGNLRDAATCKRKAAEGCKWASSTPVCPPN